MEELGWINLPLAGIMERNHPPHCVDIWNWRYLDFYQGPMTVYLHLYSTNFVSQFLLWSSIRTCLQSSHYEDNHYIFLCCECQSLSMPNKACPKVQSFLVFGLFFYWFLNYTRGRAFRREISNIHTVRLQQVNLQQFFTGFWFSVISPLQNRGNGSLFIPGASSEDNSPIYMRSMIEGPVKDTITLSYYIIKLVSEPLTLRPLCCSRLRSNEKCLVDQLLWG